MTSREKAEELANKFKIRVGVYYTEDSIPCVINAPMLNNSARQCALICVEEILEVIKELPVNQIYENTKDYWLKVKEELLNM